MALNRQRKAQAKESESRPQPKASNVQYRSESPSSNSNGDDSTNFEAARSALKAVSLFDFSNTQQNIDNCVIQLRTNKSNRSNAARELHDAHVERLKARIDEICQSYISKKYEIQQVTSYTRRWLIHKQVFPKAATYQTSDITHRAKVSTGEASCGLRQEP
jgi:hypothetical protein